MNLNDLGSTRSAENSAHPETVLFQNENASRVLPVCDHYAGNEKFIVKALELQAARAINGRADFDITADCEDGAPIGRERAHAEMITAVLGSEANRHHRLGIRVHDPRNSHWRSDLDIVLRGSVMPAYVVLPKINGRDEVLNMMSYVRDRTPQPVPIHVLIETHGALADVGAIAALDGVECLSFGLMDFISAHGGAIGANALASPGQFDHPLVRRAKLEISAACHAHGKVPSHNVTIALRDGARVADDARRASGEFGFTRMWSVHPDQIDPIVSALQPQHAEVQQAARILLAAALADWGPVDDGGALHDRASYRLFWMLLKRAHAGGMSIPNEVRARFFEGSPQGEMQ